MKLLTRRWKVCKYEKWKLKYQDDRNTKIYKVNQIEWNIWLRTIIELFLLLYGDVMRKIGDFDGARREILVGRAQNTGVHCDPAKIGTKDEGQDTSLVQDVSSPLFL